MSPTSQMSPARRSRKGTVMKTFLIMLVLLCLPVFSPGGLTQSTASDGPQYEDEMNLVLPADYREWMFLGSGLGMSYDPAEGVQSTSPQLFTNVFVNPSSYRGFMDTGRWPDRSVFILELRNSDGAALINRAGRFQTELVGLEAEVKDSRFPDGWAYYNFGQDDVAPPLTGEVVASCIQCHTEHTAVERTFVQFHPTRVEVARQKGTLKAGF